MKILYKIIKILLPIVIILLVLGISIENIAVTSFQNYILEDKVADLFIEKFEGNCDLDKLLEIKDNITNNKNMNVITKKILKQVTDVVIIKKEINLNVEKEIKNIIKEEMRGKINALDENELSRPVNNRMYKVNFIVERNVESFAQDNLFKAIVIAYRVATSIIFYIINILVIIASHIVILLEKNEEKYNTLAKIYRISTIVSLTIFLVIMLLSKKIEQYYSGGWIDSLDYSVLAIATVVQLIIWIVCKVAYLKNTKERENC